MLLSIHGGAFEMGDKRDIHVLAFLRGLPRGYAVVSVNYRLSGEAIFPAGLQDVKAAIRWLRAHAGEYSPRRRPHRCLGRLLGRQLCGDGLRDHQRGSVRRSRTRERAFPSDVQVGVDWFGPTDFLKMDEQLAANGLGPGDHSEAESPESRYLGGRITEIPEMARLASPITYVHPRMPPILIQHGRDDFWCRSNNPWSSRGP